MRQIRFIFVHLANRMSSLGEKFRDRFSFPFFFSVPLQEELDNRMTLVMSHSLSELHVHEE